MRQLEETHVHELLAQLLAYGYGELRIQVRDHQVDQIVPTLLLKRPAEVEELCDALTRVEARASVQH